MPSSKWRGYEEQGNTRSSLNFACDAAEISYGVPPWVRYLTRRMVGNIERAMNPFQRPRILLLCTFAAATGCSQPSGQSPLPSAQNLHLEADRKETDAWVDTQSAEDAKRRELEMAETTGHAWLTRSGKNEMTNTAWAVVYRYSVNTFEFAFPYQGEQRAMITFVLHSSGPNPVTRVELSVEKGQFNCDYCNITTRLDEEDPERVYFGPTNDTGRSLTTNLSSKTYKAMNNDPYMPFSWPAMMAARRLRIEPRFYRQESPILDFEIDGLAEAIAKAAAPLPALPTSGNRRRRPA